MVVGDTKQNNSCYPMKHIKEFHLQHITNFDTALQDVIVSLYVM